MHRPFSSSFCSVHYVEFQCIAGRLDECVAEKYAYLVLALGQHDPDYVDAFYGPVAEKNSSKKEQGQISTFNISSGSPTTRRTLREFLTSSITGIRVIRNSNYHYETNYFGCRCVHGSVRIGGVGLRQKDIRRPQTKGGGNEANCRTQSERG